MVIEDKLKEIKSLKRKATALRNREEFLRAIEVLDIAIKKLDSLRKEEDDKNLRAELSDTYGMKGGVYRRMGGKDNLEIALKMYLKGKDIENIDKISSYNLANVISLNIDHLGKSPSDSEIKKDLENAVERLQADTNGSRKDEWWAWSDLAQFYLLLNQPDDAKQAYVNAIEKSGPSREEVQRHKEILEALAKRIANVTPEISSQIEVIAREFLVNL